MVGQSERPTRWGPAEGDAEERLREQRSRSREVDRSAKAGRSPRRQSRGGKDGSAKVSSSRRSSKDKASEKKKQVRASPQKHQHRRPFSSPPRKATSPAPQRASSVARSSSPVASEKAGSSEATTADSPRRSVPPPKKPVEFAHRRTAGEVHRCKKGKRTDIKPTEWAKYGYAQRPELLTEKLVYEGNVVPIPRLKRKDITPEWFLENVTSKAQPVIVEDVCNEWPAMQRWSVDSLEERFRHISFKVAKDDKGKKLRMKFKYYADYVRRQQDDSPLYLFETNVDDNGYIRALVSDFEVPDLFPHDWFALVNNDSRPPFRWFCIGPKRSGTTVHTDPLGTAAWNAVTHGCKRWVLFEPKETRRIVKGRDVIKDGEDDEAIMYFDYILPRIKKAHPELKIYEGLQNPGDVIYVPGDWWHGVLNLEDTVAITQNYCGPDNFDVVWSKTRKEREKVAYLWLRNMKRYAIELHSRAIAMNLRDNFRMRHERPKGDRLSSASSSSSESSSDSSSDNAEDLDPDCLQGAIADNLKLGQFAFQKQGEGPGPGLVTAARASFERPVKKRHVGQKADAAL